MKKYLYIVVSIMLLATGCRDNSGLSGLLMDLDNRLAEVEELCHEMNTNIDALKALIEAIENNNSIVSVTPILKDGKEIGYTITFQNADPITIYNGKDGNNGSTPIIGVAQDTDGIYYWTLDGEWLLDDQGAKIPVTGNDGKNGEDGTSGTDGTDGKDGKDGITPQLKITDGYWYVSYDNGATWNQLGKAVGENGKDGTDGKDGTNGKDGKDGIDGDSMFRSLTQDDNYVYFTLADGTVITIAKGNAEDNGVEIVNGAIRMPFSVSATKKVYFSQGNLQYQASTDTWRFAEHQYDYIGGANKNISPSYTGWIDLFGWGTGNNPTLATFKDTDYAAFTDWGVNAISNGGNQPNQWRTLTKDEWEYLRTNYRMSECYINGDFGMMLFPSGWKNPLDFVCVGSNLSYRGWRKIEATGVVFFPASGYRNVSNVSYVGNDGKYWSASLEGESRAFYFGFTSRGTGGYLTRNIGQAVRLVQDVE